MAREKRPVGCCGVIVAGAAAFVLFSAIVAQQKQGARQDLPQPAPVPIDDPIGPGKTVTLTRPGPNGRTLMAVDKPSFDALVYALTEGTLGDYSRLTEADKIRAADNGTRAVVISAEGKARTVKILEGRLEGFVGWVEARYVHPAPAGPRKQADAPKQGGQPF